MSAGVPTLDRIRNLERLYELRPEAMLLNGQGNVYSDLGRHEEALAAYQRAIDLDPENVISQMALVGVYRKLDDEAAYQRQVALAQSLVVQEDEYNRAYFASICGEVDEALALAEIALAKVPGRRILAQHELDFDFIRDERRFQALVGEHEVKPHEQSVD